MAARITAMVNEVLSEEEPGAKQLSEADVLGLIDTGGSEGGSQVCPFGQCMSLKEVARPREKTINHRGVLSTLASQHITITTSL